MRYHEPTLEELDALIAEQSKPENLPPWWHDEITGGRHRESVFAWANCGHCGRCRIMYRAPYCETCYRAHNHRRARNRRKAS